MLQISIYERKAGLTLYRDYRRITVVRLLLLEVFVLSQRDKRQHFRKKAVDLKANKVIRVSILSEATLLYRDMGGRKNHYNVIH